MRQSCVLSCPYQAQTAANSQQQTRKTQLPKPFTRRCHSVSGNGKTKTHTGGSMVCGGEGQFCGMWVSFIAETQERRQARRPFSSHSVIPSQFLKNRKNWEVKCVWMVGKEIAVRYILWCGVERMSSAEGYGLVVFGWGLPQIGTNI